MKILNTLMILTALTILASCKKEYINEKRPYNSIERFALIGSAGDTVKALVNGDSINVYWNKSVTAPASITPKIVLSAGASISPASNTSVPFVKGTAYKVTAEDGTVKTYYLNPVLFEPVPTISYVAGPITWLASTEMTIYGENFLVNTDVSKISLYMQRLKDGVEIPLTLVPNSVNGYMLRAQLPTFSASQDTGQHKVYFKTNGKIAATALVQFNVPSIAKANPTSSLVEDGKDLHTGDKLTINYAFSDSYGGKIGSYYHARNIATVQLYFSTGETVDMTSGFTRGDSTVEVTVPNIDKFIGKTLVFYRFFYKSVPSDQMLFSAYYLRGFPTKTITVKAKV